MPEVFPNVCIACHGRGNLKVNTLGSGGDIIFLEDLPKKIRDLAHYTVMCPYCLGTGDSENNSEVEKIMLEAAKKSRRLARWLPT